MNPINTYLDAAVLKPELTPAEAHDAIETCIRYQARTACVRPCDIPAALTLCRDTVTAVSCVLAFPHGAALPESKGAEARRYVELGVAEIDMVVNYGLIRGGEWDRLREDIEAVTAVARPAGVAVKTIFETCCLTVAQIGQATEVAIAARADFVKTSTGFAGGGATEQAVQAMLDAAAGRIQVKASGGIRDASRARAYIEMGVTRLGVGYSSLRPLCDGGSPSDATY
jgi:deoxyribose-phosphate aldolase